MTFDGKRRIFTFVGKDDRGKDYAEMYVARYFLTDSSYSEVLEYLVLDHKNGEVPANYDYLEKEYRSAVTTDNGKLTFALPHPFENAIPVVIEFNGNSIRAKVGNDYEYFWEKE